MSLIESLTTVSLIEAPPTAFPIKAPTALTLPTTPRAHTRHAHGAMDGRLVWLHLRGVHLDARRARLHQVVPPEVTPS